jgi:hypothetical protein
VDAQGTAPAAAAPFGVGEAVSYGWAAFKKYPAPLIIAAVAVSVIGGFASNLGLLFDDQLIRIGFQIVGFVISTIVYMGFIRIVLAVTRGEDPDLGLLFSSERIGPYIGASILFGLAYAIGLILCIVPGIIVALVWGFYGWIIIDRGAGVGDSFTRSAEITKGHRGTLFVFFLAVIGINILGALVCLVGLLVSVPVTAVAHGYVYRALSGEPVAPVEA